MKIIKIFGIIFLIILTICIFVKFSGSSNSKLKKTGNKIPKTEINESQKPKSKTTPENNLQDKKPGETNPKNNINLNETFKPNKHWKHWYQKEPTYEKISDNYITKTEYHPNSEAIDNISVFDCDSIEVFKQLEKSDKPTFLLLKKITFFDEETQKKHLTQIYAKKV